MPKYRTAKPKEPVTIDDMDQYLRRIDEMWVGALMIFLWVFGVRVDEALSLTKRDFRTHEGYLYVKCPPNKNPEEPRRVLPISLDTKFLELLIDYVNMNEHGLIWPCHQSTFWRKLKKIDPTLCSHRFRHNRATQIALTRAHPYELQSWLGHTDIRMASRYIHASGIFADDLGKKLVIT